MTLVLSPVRGQPGEVLNIHNEGNSPQPAIAVDSTTLEIVVTTDTVQNLSTLPGGTATAALNSVAPTQGSGPGYLSRTVYINASDPDVGTPNNEGLVLQAATTWNTPGDIPPGDLFEVVCWSSGGAGAFGRAQSSAGTGVTGTTSSGGGGGCRIPYWFSRSDLIAALPIVMTIPGKTVSTVPPTTAGTNDAPAPAGATCSFGTLISAGGGGGGGQDGGNRAGGCGGSEGAPAVSSSSSAIGPVSAPGVALPGVGNVGSGATTATPGAKRSYGNGGASAGPASNAGELRSASAVNGAGAGGGGGNMGAGQTLADSFPGTQGGGSGPTAVGITVGGGGNGGAAALPGLPGSNGVDGKHTYSGTGGGGGASSPQLSTVGGRGGDGGNPGGGGGGGGGGRGANGTAWAGRGGFGGRGQITVTAYG